MPGGSKYEGPSAALDAYRSVVTESRSGAEVKGAKNPYTSRNGHMFSFLDQTGAMALRLSDELTEEFRSTYPSGDVQQYGATMRGYSSIPADLLNDTPTLAAWFDRSWEWIGTLPPKATKKG
ncbi:MAG: hypothetical protein QNJ81_05085 [Acidimicrobiia bacterium]|nr:hypothetical protein [Acidimicrobiia bacterium]